MELQLVVNIDIEAKDLLKILMDRKPGTLEVQYVSEGRKVKADFEVLFEDRGPRDTNWY